MTDTKGWDHSAGPWHSHDVDDPEEPFGIQWVVDIPYDANVTVDRLYFGDVETNTGRDIGNAYLVAASPDLFDACEAAREFLEVRQKLGLGRREFEVALLGRLRAAIERAKGLR